MWLIIVLRMPKVINSQFSPHHNYILLLRKKSTEKKETINPCLTTTFVTVILIFRIEFYLSLSAPGDDLCFLVMRLKRYM